MLLACADAPAAPEEHLTVRGAELTVGPDLVLRAEEATLSPSGAGQGTAASAVATEANAPPLEVTADRTQWDLHASEARFEGNVVALRGPVTLRCARLDVGFEKGSQPRIVRAVAEGAVEVVRGDQLATAERAELETGTGRLVLTGSPTLRDGPHRMAGGQIVLWLDEDRAECDACRVTVVGSLGEDATGAP